MSHALGNEVGEFTTEFEKFTSDIQSLVDEVKEEVQRTLDEYKEFQSSQTERINEIEDTVQNEVQKLKDLFKDLDQKFGVFKQEKSNIIEQSLNSDKLDFDQLNQVLEEHGRRLDEIGQAQDQFSDTSPEKLREELITGIRMLGERVSKTIEDINERINNFTNEIQSQINLVDKESNAIEGEASNHDEDEFTSLKESNLFEMSDFEIVPREAIKKLTQLFKKQSSAIKNFIEKHAVRVQEFERLLRTYDEENTRLLELLDRRVKRNFVISMGAIIIVILCSVLMRIF